MLTPESDVYGRQILKELQNFKWPLTLTLGIQMKQKELAI